MSQKLIDFEPLEPPKTSRRRINPNNRTGKMISMLLRPEGATSKQLTEALNRTKGQKLTERQVTTQWVVRSYLAPRGIGVVSKEVKSGGRTMLRMFGYEYGNEKPAMAESTKPKAEANATAKAA